MTVLHTVAPMLATQNLNAVLRVMQWGVIALIFLFFLRVLRAVWVEVSPVVVRKTRAEKREERRAERKSEAPAPAPKRRRELFLVVVQPEEHHGEAYPLDDEVTVGRSPGCGVPTTDDVYSSSLHARLFRQNGQLWVEDLGSTNGTYVNSERITQAHKLAKGDMLQVGSTVFEVQR